MAEADGLHAGSRGRGAGYIPEPDTGLRGRAEQEQDQTARAPSRADRWSIACTDAIDAVGRLKELQEEYSDWKDNLPESLQSSPVGEKLEEGCNVDLDSAESAISDAEGVDLPMGFGRD